MIIEKYQNIVGKKLGGFGGQIITQAERRTRKKKDNRIWFCVVRYVYMVGWLPHTYRTLYIG